MAAVAPLSTHGFTGSGSGIILGQVMANAHWLGQSVIYEVFVDRFHRGGRGAPLSDKQYQPAFIGGNLQGVAEKLDYLADLGVNTLWLTPFTSTAAYHGYHVLDFYSVDKRFGGFAGLGMLVKAAKARGIRLIMDFVANHVHETHPWFAEARRDKRSQYRDWFYWRRNGDYLKFLDFGELPKLNLDHPRAREEIIQAAIYWMAQGIDGFRLDHVLGPSLQFWREFRRRLQQHGEDCVLIGEIWFGGIDRRHLPTLGLTDKQFYMTAHEGGIDVQADVMREYTDVFDGILDFQFQKIMRACVARPSRPVSTAKIQAMLDRHYAGFPAQCRLLSFLDNHDMNRFLFEAGGDKTRLKKAVEIQFAQPQPPVLYYGDEIGMSQTSSIHGESHGDRRARHVMAWQQPDTDIQRLYRHEIHKWKSRCLF